MNQSYSLKELYPSMGKMLYSETFGVSLQDSLLNEIIIHQYEKKEGGFSGTLDVSESRFAEYAWLGNAMPAEGIESGEEFEITSTVSAPLTFSFCGMKFIMQKGTAVFYNRKSSGDSEMSFSGSKICGSGSLILGEGTYEADLTFTPFQDEEKTLLQFSFDRTKGVSLQDLLRHLTGSSLSIGTTFPSYMDYQEMICLDAIMLQVDSDIIKHPQNYTEDVHAEYNGCEDEMSVRMVMDLTRFEISSPWFSLDGLFMSLFYRPEPSVQIQRIGMEMQILGMPIYAVMSNPFNSFEIKVVNLEKRSIKDLLQPLNLSVPDFLSDYYLKEIFLRLMPEDGSYNAAVDVTKNLGNVWKESRPAGGSCTLSLEDFWLALDRNNGNTQAVLNISLSLTE